MRHQARLEGVFYEVAGRPRRSQKVFFPFVAAPHNEDHSPYENSRLLSFLGIIMLSCQWTLQILLLLATLKFHAAASLGIQHASAAMGIHSTKQGAPTPESSSPDLHDSSWYKRYPAYPEYCSIPQSMDRRSIPPLKTDYRVGDTRLVHVSAIIRHGARTPYDSNLDCWNGYWDSPDTAVWNCNLTTFLAPPLTATGDNDVMFLFEKKYDALQPPLSNQLNGTCQVGQLLLRGYVQELKNGQHLRNAYTFDGTNMQHDVRMRLLDLSSTDPRPYELLKYRSDDDQRTTMSGQVLLRGLFANEFVAHAKQQHGSHPIIPLHTADRPVDILTATEHTCPRLEYLRHEAENSHDYQALMKSKEALLLTTFINTELGQGVMQKDGVDCIMTTICTDRPLPQRIDDYGRNTSKYHDEYGDNLLQRIYENVSCPKEMSAMLGICVSTIYEPHCDYH